MFFTPPDTALSKEDYLKNALWGAPLPQTPSSSHTQFTPQPYLLSKPFQPFQQPFIQQEPKSFSRPPLSSSNTHVSLANTTLDFQPLSKCIYPQDDLTSIDPSYNSSDLYCQPSDSYYNKLYNSYYESHLYKNQFLGPSYTYMQQPALQQHGDFFNLHKTPKSFHHNQAAFQFQPTSFHTSPMPSLAHSSFIHSNSSPPILSSQPLPPFLISPGAKDAFA